MHARGAKRNTKRPEHLKQRNQGTPNTSAATKYLSDLICLCDRRTPVPAEFQIPAANADFSPGSDSHWQRGRNGSFTQSQFAGNQRNFRITRLGLRLPDSAGPHAESTRGSFWTRPAEHNSPRLSGGTVDETEALTTVFLNADDSGVSRWSRLCVAQLQKLVWPRALT